MNKKGMDLFTPLFAIITIVVLGALAYTIEHSKVARETGEIAGERTAGILRIYDEGENAMNFISLAVKQAEQITLKTLADNGGYSADTTCKFTEPSLTSPESFAIWNACPQLDADKNFNEQLKKDIKNYLQSYQTLYKPLEFKSVSYEGLLTSYTENIKKAEPLSIKKEDGNLIIDFNPITYTHPNYKYTIHPKAKIISPDLHIYKAIHSAAFNYCILKTIAECKKEIESVFPTASLTVEGLMIKIKIPQDYGTIKIAIDTAKPLQKVPVLV